MPDIKSPAGVEIHGQVTDAFAEILTPEALEFAVTLHRHHNARRKELLARRLEVQKELDAGELPDFDPETKAIREGDWTIAGTPADLQDRRVEITGPVDRKMVINALNSGAYVFMADFEDSNAPTWENCIHGQINLRDANRRTITFEDPARGKSYKLGEKPAVLLVRPRGWHLLEEHITVDGEPMSASILDFALYLYHNHAQLKQNGSGPYYYLPKLEHYLEARLWNDVIVEAQNLLGIPQGTVKSTILIETILASFYLDEILYELKDHIVGLNCGRWDYIFSYIKRLKGHNDRILPDRSQVTMTVPFMRNYSKLVIKTCHKRGAHAMGGMAAQIPIKNDEAANEAALAKVKADKEREANDGHDGTWVAHPGLVQIALDAFNNVMKGPNQIHRKLEDFTATAADLIAVPEGTITEAGLRNNIDVAIQYIESWLRGTGCVPIYNLMEDAATAEISRAQVWQWVHKPGVKLDDGREIDLALYEELLNDEVAKMKDRFGEQFGRGQYEQAVKLFDEMIRNEQFTEFLTLPAYEHIK